MRISVTSLILSCLLAGCPGGDDAPSDAPCDLAVVIGTGTPDAFAPVVDGDPAEVILGFQGFRMLTFTLRLAGVRTDRAEVSGYVVVEESGVEVAQLPRTVLAAEGPDGALYVRDFLLFFNDAPASEIVGHDGEVELIARAAGCTGASRVTVALRDDEDCVDPDAVIPDAGGIDGGVPEGTAICGAEP